MKILHFADAHIGVTTHGKIYPTTGLNDRVLDFLNAFDFIIDYIEANDIELVLFAGDMFHSNKPSPQLVSEVVLRIMDIASMCPIVMIPGNHDQAINRVSALDFLSVVGLPNVYVSDEPCHYVLDGVLIGAIPYPVHNHYGIQKTVKNADLELIEAVYDKIDEMLGNGHYKSRILLFHGTLEGSKYGAWAESTLASESQLFEEELVDWDYVALGHIHMHQAIGNAVYSGSIERVDFGEANEPKGFIVLDTNAIDDWKFITIPTRPMLTMEIDLRDVEPGLYNDTIKEIINSYTFDKNYLVKINILHTKYEVYSLPDVDYMFQLLGGNVYRVCAINVIRDNVIKDRQRELPDNLMGMAKVEQIEEWLVMKDVPDDDIDAVLDIFEGIINESQ